MNHRTIIGLPAIFSDSHWIVMSNDFRNIARIPLNEIDNQDTIDQLRKAGFVTVSQKKNTELQITLILTSSCNLRCIYCFADCGIKNDSMSYITAQSIIKHAITIANGRRLSVSFFGGEPTLEFNLLKKIVAYVNDESKRNNLPKPYFGITSNGTFNETVLQYLTENLFQITISADGIPKIQDVQRPMKNGKSSSILVENTIRSLAQKDYYFKVRATVTNQSVTIMKESIKWLSKLGGKEIQFEPVSIAGRASDDPMSVSKPSSEDFVKNLIVSIEEGTRLGVGVSHSSFMNLVNTPFSFCEGNLQNRFAVTCDGTITSCVEVQNKCHPAANIFHLGKIDPVSGQLTLDTAVRRNCSSHCDDSFESGSGHKCSDCFASRICGGGCPVRNFHANGDVGVVDEYRCKITRELIPYIYRSVDNNTPK